MRIREVIVVYDVGCPNCSQVARELPDLLCVPVRVRSCRDSTLAAAYPTVPASVRACARPAVGTVRADGSVRWWPGLTGAVALVPVVRPRALREAVLVLWAAFRTPRARDRRAS